MSKPLRRVFLIRYTVGIALSLRASVIMRAV